MASTQSTSSLPQGFSVYQPSLGAPLQFFPALGSQQLDELINAFIPGPSPASEKRATISLDFLEYAQMSGQTFKFYAVHSTPSAATSPSTASPSLDSVNSSFDVSPLTASWDWSATSAPSIASSSRGSNQRRQQGKSSSPTSRHQTTDFSHLPGMKILTKDGEDVTNSASRGSKTKEQRDHAHLMRIIKACDSCRRKKIRCDPSHKKRGAAQVTPQPAQKAAKKARTEKTQVLPSCPQPATISDTDLMFSSSSFDLSSSFDFSALDNHDLATMPYDLFDEFVQIPTLDTSDFDFLLDSGDYLSSQPTTTTASSSASSPLKSCTPSSQKDPNAPPGHEFVTSQLRATSPGFTFTEPSGSSSDYTDFNLYSPVSTFSEDERMLPIGSSTGSLPSLNEPSLSECPPPSYESMAHGEAFEWDGPGLLQDELQFHSINEFVGGSGSGSLSGSNGQLATTRRVVTAGQPVDGFGSKPVDVSGPKLQSQVVICCPPGTVVVSGETSSAGLNLGNVSTSFNSSAESTSIDVRISESPGVIVDRPVTSATSGVSNISGLPAESAGQSALASTNSHSSEPPAELAHQSALLSANRIILGSPTSISDSDQDRVASVDRPDSLHSQPGALSVSTGNDLQPLSTNGVSDLIDDSSSSSTHERLIGLERPVLGSTSVVTSGTASRPDRLVNASTIADHNDERLPPISVLRAQAGVVSHSSAAAIVPLRDNALSVLSVSGVPGERSTIHQLATHTVGPFPGHDQTSTDHLDDQDVPTTPSPDDHASHSSAQHLVLNANLGVSAPGVVSGEDVVRFAATSHAPAGIEQPRSPPASESETQSDAALPSMAQAVIAASNLALYVFSAAMAASNTNAEISPRSMQSVASCRTTLRRSSMRQPLFPALSHLCVA